ncbi:MAG: DUF4127 family protein, partial [Turicibacter sp.]
MKKVVLLPLDERPCNFEFPYKLFNNDELEIIRPITLGDKKIPANTDQVIEFLKSTTTDADGLVISLDTLLYGGLIPSRLHHLTDAELEKRLHVLKEIKAVNPSLVIYAFGCIMRCPKYSSSDEEPDYYEICGAEIHKIGAIIHKNKLGECELADGDALKKIAKDEYLTDYTNRRQVNLDYNLKTIDFVQDGIIDFLVIPQDDSAEYGFTAMDQIVVRNKINENMLNAKIYVYPGADEVALTLLARLVNKLSLKKPKVYVRYSSTLAMSVVPPYEDRAISETIKYHLLSAGCRVVDSLRDCDFVLAVNCPAHAIKEAVYQPVTNKDYSVNRNLTEFVDFISDCIEEDIPVAISDSAYANGGDLELIKHLNSQQLLDKVLSYAGWNTNANTLGTAIGHAVYNLNFKQSKLDFLMLRYYEDVLYCAKVRRYVADHYLEINGMNYFDVKDQQGIISEIVHQTLVKFSKDYLSSVCDQVKINQVRMPWRRMFEVDIDLSYHA